MSSRLRDRSRRVVIAALMMFGMTGGCTGYVNIPPDQFEASTHDEYLSHRIRTKTTEYIVHRFSFTDSTLVISELSPADTRYRLEKPPIVVPRNDIESLAGVKDSKTTPFVVGIVAGALVMTVLWLAAEYGAGGGAR
jgi:hypothetical protein